MADLIGGLAEILQNFHINQVPNLMAFQNQPAPAPAAAAIGFDPSCIIPKPEKYDGTRDALILRRWLDSFEDYAEAINLENDQQKICIATFFSPVGPETGGVSFNAALLGVNLKP